MSIFQAPQIKVGDVVIGKRRLTTSKQIGSVRYFDEPSLVLEIKNDRALVFFEQDGPVWYNISELERCYVREEFETK